MKKGFTDSDVLDVLDKNPELFKKIAVAFLREAYTAPPGVSNFLFKETKKAFNNFVWGWVKSQEELRNMFPREMTIRSFDAEHCILSVYDMPDDIARGDILEGGHRVAGVVAADKICIVVNNPATFTEGAKIRKIGTVDIISN